MAAAPVLAVAVVALAAVGTRSADPPFVARVASVSAADLGDSYHGGCPVGPSDLRRLRLAYWGFDGRRHLGGLIVNHAVVDQIRTVFRQLYAKRFPIRLVRPVDAYGASDARSMAADNTSAFNCRPVVGPGPRRWSVHAYGEAIDVNPVENPYVDRGVVRPPSGSAFLRRTNERPGMATAGGVLVRAFESVGWAWGGRWSSPDYQHFSATGG
jgi:D-alanyl-D-alanine carboxypeptidase-like protein